MCVCFFFFFLFRYHTEDCSLHSCCTTARVNHPVRDRPSISDANLYYAERGFAIAADFFFFSPLPRAVAIFVRFATQSIITNVDNLILWSGPRIQPIDSNR